MTARITSLEITAAQKKQMARLVEDAMTELGLNKDDVKRVLAQGGLFQERLTPILKDFALEKPPSLTHAAKHIPNGWEVVKGEDVAPTLTSVADFEPVEFLTGSKDCVVGETMRKRGIEKQAMLGLSDAVLMHEHQAEIPTEMRQYVLVFAGTTLRDSDGSRRVAYLDWHWRGGRWALGFDWLVSNFSRSFRLARRKSAGT